MQASQIELLRLLATRLERLSVDSVWARRASGLRGNVIKVLDEIDGGAAADCRRLDSLIEHCFDLLGKAAREIPDLDEIRKVYRR